MEWGKKPLYLFHLKVDTPIRHIVGSVLTSEVCVGKEVIFTVVPVAEEAKLFYLLLVLFHELLLKTDTYVRIKETKTSKTDTLG